LKLNKKKSQNVITQFIKYIERSRIFIVIKS